ncbi:MAG: 1,4-alpha-glucan branching protein GlgB [Bacteroidales bacterium]|nr:1,4-alpha-glucan branching protein GlgB [Clostridium sp.]MCM1202550.1 1,4-alpha-glucan branching protein GlgB [Bacteroidales bacterium]
MANKKPVFAINWTEVEALAEGRHDNPHHILGMHETIDGVYINAYFPGAESVTAVCKQTRKKYRLVSDRIEGFYSIKVEDRQSFVYFFEVVYPGEKKRTVIDPYAFEPVIDPIDISKFNDGVHYEIYEKLGAHPCMLDGIKGVLFAVWAPHAVRVSVVGNFNKWNGKVHTMRRIEYSGIFELFIPGLEPGEIYKYEIQTKAGYTFMKPDPYGNFSEMRPANASKIADLSYDWKDAAYIEKQTMVKKEMPMNIYEVHLGSFKRPADGREFFTYREIAKELADYVADMGYTHIELMPIMEHEQDSSLGYQTAGFYAPTSRYGEPVDFMYFVDYMHSKGIGVICGWVPSQFPMTESGMARFDGEPLYEPQDSRRSENPRWGTYIFDYERKEVKNYLISNAIYWVSKYHLDGLRIDNVASMLYLDYGKPYGCWIPNQYGGNENLAAIAFFKELNTIMNERFPNCMMIVEEESGWPMLTEAIEEGGMGFDYRFNMSWMRDLLSYMALDPLYRKYEHKKLTNSLSNAYDEKYILEFSHTEVVGGKGSIVDQMPGGYEEKFSNLRLLYGYMMMHPGKKLLFMGQEFAQFKEFSEAGEIDWGLLEFDAHTILRNYVKALNHLYKKEPALFAMDNNAEGFQWINANAANESIVSFLRRTARKEDTLLIICNFTPVSYDKYKVGVPFAGTFKEIFCSDMEKFGGDGSKNPGVRVSRKSACDGRSNSITIGLAPLSMSIFKMTKSGTEGAKKTKKDAEKKKAPEKGLAGKGNKK